MLQYYIGNIRGIAREGYSWLSGIYYTMKKEQSDIEFEEMMNRAKKQWELLKKKQESIDISQVPF